MSKLTTGLMWAGLTAGAIPILSIDDTRVTKITPIMETMLAPSTTPTTPTKPVTSTPIPARKPAARLFNIKPEDASVLLGYVASSMYQLANKFRAESGSEAEMIEKAIAFINKNGLQVLTDMTRVDFRNHHNYFDAEYFECAIHHRLSWMKARSAVGSDRDVYEWSVDFYNNPTCLT